MLDGSLAHLLRFGRRYSLLREATNRHWFTHARWIAKVCVLVIGVRLRPSRLGRVSASVPCHCRLHTDASAASSPPRVVRPDSPEEVPPRCCSGILGFFSMSGAICRNPQSSQTLLLASLPFNSMFLVMTFCSSFLLFLKAPKAIYLDISVYHVDDLASSGGLKVWWRL